MLMVDLFGLCLLVSLCRCSLYERQAEWGEFPFVAAMRNSKTGVFRCVGILITTSKILTAGECVVYASTTTLLDPADYEFLAGTRYLWPKEVGFQTRQIKEFYLHPKMKKGLITFGYNMGLAYLVDAFSKHKAIKVIRLASANVFRLQHIFKRIRGTHVCFVLGWNGYGIGAAKYPIFDNDTMKFIYDNDSSSLRVIDVQFGTYKSCEQTFCRFGRSIPGVCSHFFQREKEVCAFPMAGVSPICGWCDCMRGAPVVCRKKGDGKLHVWGLVSWGVGCGSREIYPSAYASFQIIAEVLIMSKLHLESGQKSTEVNAFQIFSFVLVIIVS